jgi:hypothetical protein
VSVCPCVRVSVCLNVQFSVAVMIDMSISSGVVQSDVSLFLCCLRCCGCVANNLFWRVCVCGCGGAVVRNNICAERCSCDGNALPIYVPLAFLACCLLAPDKSVCSFEWCLHSSHVPAKEANHHSPLCVRARCLQLRFAIHSLARTAYTTFQWPLRCDKKEGVPLILCILPARSTTAFHVPAFQGNHM